MYDPTDALWITRQWRDNGDLTFAGKILAVKADGTPFEVPDFEVAASMFGFATLGMIELCIIQRRVLPWRNTTVTLHWIKKGRKRICKSCHKFASAGEVDGVYFVECTCGRFESKDSMRESVKLWRRLAARMELWRQ